MPEGHPQLTHRPIYINTKLICQLQDLAHSNVDPEDCITGLLLQNALEALNL